MTIILKTKADFVPSPCIIYKIFNKSPFSIEGQDTTCPIRVQSIVAAYAFSHFFSNVEKLFFHTSTEMPLIVNLVQTTNESAPDYHRRIRAVLLHFDARDLYSAIINAEQMISIMDAEKSDPKIKNIKEGFEFSKLRLEEALIKKIYKGIINCLLFTYVDSVSIATQNKCRLRNIRRLTSSLNHRLSKLAEYAIKPKNCTTSIPVLAILSPPDVPQLLCYFTTNKEINSQALSIWSNIVSGRGEEPWNYKHQRLLMSALGIQGKTSNKHIAAMQRQAMRSDVFDSLENYIDIHALNIENNFNENFSEIPCEEDLKEAAEHTRVISKSIKKVADISDWKIDDEVELVKTALETGARWESRDQNNFSPLWKCEEPRVAKLLLKYKADVNVCDNYGNNAAHFAVKNSALGVLRELIQHDKELLDRPNKLGRTPLHITMLTLRVVRSNFAIAHFLFDQGAKVTLLDAVDSSPYSIAKNYHEELQTFSLKISENQDKVRYEILSKIDQVHELLEKFTSRLTQNATIHIKKASFHQTPKVPSCFELICPSVYRCFLSCFPCCRCLCDCSC